ncbi:MAG: DUF1080 domain-containing protein, partial [Armatimonadetes bacterium]|nr:DUF1080 domain-containing protein [Armatimonadota bacterium]
MTIWLLSLALLAPVEATFDDPAGLPAGWTTAGGRWAVDSGRLVQSSLSARGAYAWLTTSAWGDVDVSTRFRPNSTGSGVRAAGLVFRATDSRHGYYVHFDAANSQVVLVRQSAEQSWHELARRGGIPIALDAWHEGRVVVRGALIEVFLDGREVASAEDATYTAGYVGLRAGQGIIAFDNLRVDGKPAACAPFEVTMDPNDLSGLPR